MKNLKILFSAVSLFALVLATFVVAPSVFSQARKAGSGAR